MNTIKRKITSIGLILALAIGLLGSGFLGETNTAVAATGKTVTGQSEVRAMWFAFCDFEALGLYNKSKKTFTANIQKALAKAKTNGCNTIYWHARAFDDATWKSKTFKASQYLTSKAGKKTATKTYSYDPLKIVVTEAHKKNLRVEAWMNPYRIEHTLYLNPKSSASTKRIKRAIKELKSYDLDGIHFDDYFYHSTGKYISPSAKTKYKVTVKGKKTAKKPSAKKQRKYVNKMVKAVYKYVHKKKGWIFGISPAGNYENCMAGGADVKTWLSKKGYVDYLIPQIYWTDNWGSAGNVKMFTNRMKQFKKLNKRGVDMYIGLALYRTGKKASDDKGWGKRNTNMANQVKKLRKAGMKGYALFEASDLYRKGAKKELANLKKVL